MHLVNYYSIPGLKREFEAKEKPETFIPTSENIINLICIYRGITWEQITGSRGNDEILIARFLICHFLLIYAKMSRAAIGRLINRDHATVINALKKLNNLIKTSPSVASQVTLLTQIIENKQ